MNSFGKVYVGSEWMVVKCNHSLGQYLRKLYSMKYYGCRKLQRPSKGEHITIVSPHEGVVDMKTRYFLWNNLIVPFELDLNPYHNGNAVWYPASSFMIDYMRADMGLPNPRPIPLHFCIGYFNSGLPENFSEISQDFA